MYMEDMANSLDVISIWTKSSPQDCPTRSGLNISCATCSVKKVALQMCSRCKSVSYCSTHCQKKDWIKHKSCCLVSSSQERKVKQYKPCKTLSHFICSVMQKCGMVLFLSFQYKKLIQKLNFVTALV